MGPMLLPLRRRDLLRGAIVSAAGMALGGTAKPRAAAATVAPPAAAAPAAAAAPPVPALKALSLGELSRRALKGPGVSDLGGFTSFTGWVHDPVSDDVILLGYAGAGHAIHIDDLCCVLRHALAPSSTPPIGCTIDPIIGQVDPWSIQKAEIFGIPVCRMGVRHVAIDWDLKWQSAGLARPAAVPDAFAAERDAAMRCGDGDGAEQRAVTHRFWFCARLEPGPRYTVDDHGCIVDVPVGVQLKTEQEFLEGGHRVDAGPASPSAEQFALAITEAMRSGSYAAELVSDFRLIELCRLLVYRGTRLGVASDLIEQHRLEPVQFDGYVGGVHRSEEGEFLCSSRIVRTEAAEGTNVQSQRNVRRYRLEYRGGVEAKVPVVPADLRPDDGALADLRRRVLASRRPEALCWSVS